MNTVAAKSRRVILASMLMLAAMQFCFGRAVTGEDDASRQREDSTKQTEAEKGKEPSAPEKSKAEKSDKSDSEDDESHPDEDSKAKDSKEESKDSEDKDGNKDSKDKDKDKDSDDEKPKKATPVMKPETAGFDIIPAPRMEIPEHSPVAAIWLSLRAAELEMKFAVAEHGNMAAFARARRSLDKAREQLAEATSNKDGDPELLKGATTALESLERDAVELDATAAKTLFGRFPLIRAFGIDPTDDEDLQIRSFSNPGVAERRAVASTLTKIAKSAATDPLSVVIFVPGANAVEAAEGPLAELVDSEAPLAFDQVADARLYPGRLRYAWGPMPAWDTPDPAMDAVCRRVLKFIHPAKEPRSLMLVLVREFADRARGTYWVQAQQRTYELSTLEDAEEKPDKLEADKVRAAETLVHDRSRFAPAILGGAACLWLVGLGLQALLSLRSPQSRGWLNWLAVPTFGFLMGMILTPLLMLALKRGLPDPQSSLLVGGWWPCVAGALSLILPAGIFRMGAGSAGRYLPAISCHGRWGTAFVPVALGIAAAWIRPATYALEGTWIPFVVALSTAAALLVYCFGRAIDLADHFPVTILPITLSLALVFGGGAFLGSPVILALVAGGAGLTTVLHTWFTRRRATASLKDDEMPAHDPSRGRRPRTVAQLRAALEAPLYQPPPEFQRLKRMIEQAGITRSTWIGMVGPSAAGKSAAARHLISELRSSEANIEVLVGRCVEGGAPFHPFRDALAEVGVSARLMTARASGGDVNTIIDRLADEFIPFWDFFSGAADDEEEDEVAKADLLAAVTNGLHQLAQNQPVVLFIDDIQWLDEGSAAVLKHLREKFAPGGELPLLIVVASRDPEAIKQLELEDTVISLTPPTAAEQIDILERSLGIERTSAGRVVNALGVMSHETGGMFWLMRAVQELVNENAFVASPRGLSLRPQYMKPGQMPVPAGMREKLATALRASGEYQPILECAALLGEKFRVNDLAECLQIDRLRLLQVLRHLEGELQLLRDVPADEECYAFSSTFMLEIVREELGVGNGVEHGKTNPSKIACEWHARIAAVYEKRTPRTPDLAYLMARHYFAAGKLYAPQSVENCLGAARVARRQQAFGLAREFVEMARRSARLIRQPTDTARELKIIDECEARARRTDQKNGRLSKAVAGR